MAAEKNPIDELKLKRALSKFNWKIDDAVRYLKFGHKVGEENSSARPFLAHRLMAFIIFHLTSS